MPRSGTMARKGSGPKGAGPFSHAARVPCPGRAGSATLRSVRRIFPDVQEVNCPEGARETTLGCAAGKNDFVLSAGGGNQEGVSPSWTFPRRTRDESPRSAARCYRGCPLSGSPRSGLAGGGAAPAVRRGVPVGCLLLSGVPAIRLAAKRPRRRWSRSGGRTGVPGRLPASIEGNCHPTRRGAASPASGRDGR